MFLAVALPRGGGHSPMMRLNAATGKQITGLLAAGLRPLPPSPGDPAQDTTRQVTRRHTVRQPVPIRAGTESVGPLSVTVRNPLLVHPITG